MPRTADPQLEGRVVKAALRLLDSGGLAAVTMRAVAGEVHTTTPSIYERFTNREALLESVRQEAELEMLGAVRPARNVKDFVKRGVEFGLQHPHRFELTADTFGFRLVSEHPMPIYELLKEHITNEAGLSGAKREQLAMAIASLLLGTTRGMIAAGNNTPAGKDLQRTCLAAARLLLQAGSDSSGPPSSDL